jgi:circadian clock protein KaiB
MDKGFIFRLFVAGDESHSKMAVQNLKRLCETRLDGSYEIEIVDVLQSYEIAIDQNIFLTPALVLVSPEPAVTVFGDLSDTAEVSRILRLKGVE